MFAIDGRALAVFRICLGVLLLFDLYFRSQFLTAHYTDCGLYSRSIANGYAGGVVGSVYMLGGSGWFVAMLFGIAAILAVMLLVGYETLLATFGCWAMLASLHSRNANLLNAGDLLLCLLLCWSIFLPLGDYASVDSRRSRRSIAVPRSVFTIGTFAILSQVILVYLCTGLKKADPVWYTEGTALYYALNLDQFATALGHKMLELPQIVLRISTIGAVWLEVAGWIFLFIPFYWARFRIAAVLSYMALHVGIGLTLHVGLFTLVCIVAWILFLPTEFWDWVQRTAVGSRIAGVWAWFLDRFERWREDDAEPASPVAPSPKESAMDKWIVGIMLGFVLWCNVGGFIDSVKIPKTLSHISEALRLNQDWSMFSPHPPSLDGWFLVPATLEDGSEVDLYSLVDGSPTTVDWSKPDHTALTFPTQRWRKYMSNIWMLEKHRKHVEHFADYLRRAWNTTNPPDKQITSMSVYIMVEYTAPPGKEPWESRELMYEWNGDDDFRVISHTQTMDNLAKVRHEHESNEILDLNRPAPLR